MSIHSAMDTLPIEDRPFQLDRHGPIFVLGCPRSGTTFLSKCMSKIRGYRSYVGILAPPRLMHIIGSNSSKEHQNDIMLSVRDIFWQTFWRDEYFKKRKIQFLLDKSINIFQWIQEASMKNLVFCYKEPFLCFAARQFAEHFPNSKFIHIIRDGRDNADSMCRTYADALTNRTLSSDTLCMNKVSEIGKWNRVNGFNFPWYVEESNYSFYKSLSAYARYVWLWREMTIRSRELQNQIESNRYLEVKYEEIASNPKKESKRIENFLGLEAEHKFRRNMQKIHSRSVSISVKNQSRERIEEADKIAKDLLENLGYIN